MRNIILTALQRFIRLEQSSGLILMGCLAAALLLAHSDYATAYEKMLHGYSLQHWINDGFMAVFFFLVGLEIKREVIGGELSELRQALFPVLAALGGMLVPALIYGTLNWNGMGKAGWAIPMATDIAFALGVLALLGQRAPISLKLFLSALAIVDDIGAVLVIALFYSGSLSWLYLSGALAVSCATLAAAAFFRIRNPFFYLSSLGLIWLCFVPSGVHATLAGIVAALLVPASPTDEKEPSPLESLEEMLHPWVAYLILPAFVLANAGLRLSGDMKGVIQDPVFLGTLCGLVLGKPLGILAFTWIGCTLRWAQKPENLCWNHILGVGFIAGIGFTMSLFVSGLSFPESPHHLDTAKFAVISASFFAGILGLGLLHRICRK